MLATLAFLRTTRLRAFVAWTVAFGLVLQLAMPIMVSAARTSNPLAAGVICLTAPDGQMAAGAGPNAPAGDKAPGDCCPACALLHVAKLAAPFEAAPVVVPVPQIVTRLAFAGDVAPRAAAPPAPYSSRGPPEA